MTENFIEKDQATMALADNYLDFLFSLVAPFQHGDVLEIGSGRGNITERTLKNNAQQIDSLTCIEPDPVCIKALKEMSAKYPAKPLIIEGYFPEAAFGSAAFDLIFSFNVLEHIEDDQNALSIATHSLKPKGILFAYVPAFPILYGSMDEVLHHCRRYSKKGLRENFMKCGLNIVELRYYNFIGFWGWFINNRIFRIKEQKNAQVKLFDKLLPLQTMLEKRVEPLVGQNLLIIGEKV